MKDLAAIFRAHQIKVEELANKLTFTFCPLCQAASQASLNEAMFLCVKCCEGISIETLMRKLNIPYDTTSEDFAYMFAEKADQILDPKNQIGVSTGYPSLDEKTNGLKQGHLYILAAETGMGKSVLAVNIILNAIRKEEVTCSYFDLENGSFASSVRILAIQAARPVKELKMQESLETASELTGKLIYRDHVKLAPYVAHKQGGAMAKEIGNLITRDMQEKGSRIVVIDPLENFELGETDYNSISKVVIYFKNLAQELGISIMILHHIRKTNNQNSNMVDDITEVPKVKYRIPTLNDLIGSSKITNMATDVWVLVRQKDSQNTIEQGRTLLRLLKQRESTDMGDVYLVMNLENLKFGELDTSYHSEPEQTYQKPYAEDFTDDDKFKELL